MRKYILTIVLIGFGLGLLFYSYIQNNQTKCIVTAEEHNILDWLGKNVVRILSLNNPITQEFVAVNDTFDESGIPAQLMEKYKLNDKAIVDAVKKVIKRK